MYQTDQILRSYAECGLRSIEDWTAHGRDVLTGAKPRVDAVRRGFRMELYSRDQTQRRSPSKRRLPHWRTDG
jgi:hypothetical protein